MSRATRARTAEESLVDYLLDPAAMQARLEELRATIAEADRKLAAVETLEELQRLRVQAGAKLEEATAIRRRAGEEMLAAQQAVATARATAARLVDEAQQEAERVAAGVMAEARQTREQAEALRAQAGEALARAEAREAEAARATAEATHARAEAEALRAQYDTKLGALRALAQ